MPASLVASIPAKAVRTCPDTEVLLLMASLMWVGGALAALLALVIAVLESRR